MPETENQDATSIRIVALAVGSLLVAAPFATGQVERQERRLPPGVSQLKLAAPLEMSGVGRPAVLHESLIGAVGRRQVIVRLKTPAVGKLNEVPLADLGYDLAGARFARRHKILDEQRGFLDRCRRAAPAAEVLTEAQTVLNALILDVDASALPALAQDPAVERIAPVANYQMDLSETVPYIGAAAVQAKGYNGKGIRVAVLDSGIDYTHAALGGSGNPADYAANDPTFVEPGTFPTAKVVGGYDFVGGDWTGGAGSPPLAPDPDPLDKGSGAGHGTHVAHIIGGVGGVAPGVDLYAVKVCSSISTACSGMALIQGMEFAVDPNGDGDLSDHVDIINMSLGSPYGQPFDDDLSLAVDNASAIGVLTVAAAGNGGDKPYVNDTPGAAPTALSVAQTQVPSASLQFITVDSVDYPAEFQPWSVPLTGTLSGPVQYGDGAGGNFDGCESFAHPLTGLIVLVDRGSCNFTLKISNISQAGGLVGIIGLVAPGAPFAGGDGGERPIDIPGYMISQADSNAIKAQIGGPGVGTADPNNKLALVGQMVGSSSRGPQHENTTLIKPEIGAPGASVSAIAGTGTGQEPFGGTSGATPMVAGSAALLLQAQPGLSPLEVKARLMNNAETSINTDPFTGLAPITRIGAGEVRVDRAFFARAAAWEDRGTAGALSFGFVDVGRNLVTLHKRVRVRNYSHKDVWYSIRPTFRYADDEASRAVSLHAPWKVRVRAHRDVTFPVEMTIKGWRLPGNFMNSGSEGANPNALTANEYDGYLILDDGHHPIHLPWHVLPRKAANVVASPLLHFEGGTDVVRLANIGVGTAQNDAYSLLAVSPNTPEGGPGQESPTPDIRAVGINTFPVPAGYCSTNPSFIWAFAINTWERQQHLVPVVHNVDLDVDQDGIFDYEVFNFDQSLSGSLSDGRQLTWVANLATNSASAYFYAEHSTNTGNTVLYVCGEQVGLTGTDMLATNVDMSVYAQDWYYGGPGDEVGGLTVTPLGEQYYGVPEDVPGRSFGEMTVYDYDRFPGNSPELGVLLITNGDRGAGARGGATKDTEALLFKVKKQWHHRAWKKRHPW
jgi:minor extracellular serine protease Vpr